MREIDIGTNNNNNIKCWDLRISGQMKFYNKQLQSWRSLSGSKHMSILKFLRQNWRHVQNQDEFQKQIKVDFQW